MHCKAYKYHTVLNLVITHIIDISIRILDFDLMSESSVCSIRILNFVKPDFSGVLLHQFT